MGAAGATASAWIAGRTQGRVQHSHWRRQVRRDAYSSLLTVANGVYASYGPAARAMKAGHRFPTVELPESLLPALSAAASAVSLEGPPDVARAAHGLVGLCGEWGGAMLLFNSGHEMQQEHPELSHLVGQDVVALGNSVRDAVDRFEELARAALDAKDGSLEGR